MDNEKEMTMAMTAYPHRKRLKVPDLHQSRTPLSAPSTNRTKTSAPPIAPHKAKKDFTDTHDLLEELDALADDIDRMRESMKKRGSPLPTEAVAVRGDQHAHPQATFDAEAYAASIAASAAARRGKSSSLLSTHREGTARPSSVSRDVPSPSPARELSLSASMLEEYDLEAEEVEVMEVQVSNAPPRALERLAHEDEDDSATSTSSLCSRSPSPELESSTHQHKQQQSDTPVENYAFMKTEASIVNPVTLNCAHQHPPEVLSPCATTVTHSSLFAYISRENFHFYR